MDDLRFFQLFGDIDADIVQQANDDLNAWQESQKGVVVRAGSPRKMPLKIVFASVACAAAVFGAVFMLRNYLKNGFMYEPVNSSDSSVQSGENSVTEIEYSLNSDVMWAIGKTMGELTERYGEETGGGGRYQFKNGYGTYGYDDGECKSVLVKASDLLIGDLSTVTLDNIVSKFGFEVVLFDPENNTPGLYDLYDDFKVAYFTHPSYKNITFLMEYKTSGFDEDTTFLIKPSDNNSLESMSNPLSRTECEQIVTLFKDWGDLDYNIHPDQTNTSRPDYFPECVDASQFFTEEVTTIDGYRTYTEYFYLIASGDFATEEGFNRKLDGMFTEKFKEQYKGSSSWRDFRFKDGEVYVSGFNHYSETEPKIRVWLEIKSVDETTVELSVMDFGDDNAREYTATLFKTKGGDFKIDEVGDGSFFEIPSLFHYKNIEVIVNWQGKTLFTLVDNSSTSEGEPTFLIGPDGNAILTSEITRLENTDKTAETLTKDDLFAHVYCDGFAYYKEPCGVGYDSYKNPELFDGYKFLGEIPENKNEWKRVNVGDEIFGLKVKSATAHFFVNDFDNYTFPERYFSNNGNGIELEGTIEVEGFLQVNNHSAFYPNTSELMWFYPSSVNLPLTPYEFYVDEEKGFTTVFNVCGLYNLGSEFVCAGEFDYFNLGYYRDAGCNMDGIGTGDIVYARVTLSNISCYGDGATATLEKVELLSDILAHVDDELGAKPFEP